MGLFLDLFQQSRIVEQSTRSGALEQRVAHLEEELQRTQQLLRDVIGRLEEHVGRDLDRDGRIGR